MKRHVSLCPIRYGRCPRLASEQWVSKETVLFEKGSSVVAFLQKIRQENVGTEVLYVDHPDTIANQLVELVVCPNTGGCEMRPGRFSQLFSDHPCIVVIDFREMTAKQASSLNDLFDVTSTYDGRAVSSSVRLISVIDVVAITQSLVFGDPNVGLSPDFFSRLAPPRRLGFPLTEPFLPTMECGSRDDFVEMGGAALSWQRILLGEPEMTETGRLSVVPGALVVAVLVQKSDIVLKNAPWESHAFANFIHEVLALGYLVFNGDRLPLPTGFQIYKAEGYTEAELQCFAAVSVALEASSSYAEIVVDTDTIGGLFSQTVVAPNGALCRGDGFLATATDGDRIKVSGLLSAYDWYRLLLAVGDLNKTKTIPVRILVENSANQSVLKTFGVSLADGKSEAAPVSCGIRHIVDSDDADWALSRYCRKNKISNPYVLDIHAGMEADAVLGRLNVLSVSERRYEWLSTDFVEALNSGRTVFVRGYASEPQLKSLVSGLLASTPQLLINGELCLFPNAHIVFLSDRVGELTDKEAQFAERMPYHPKENSKMVALFKEAGLDIKEVPKFLSLKDKIKSLQDVKLESLSYLQMKQLMSEVLSVWKQTHGDQAAVSQAMARVLSPMISDVAVRARLRLEIQDWTVKKTGPVGLNADRAKVALIAYSKTSFSSEWTLLDSFENLSLQQFKGDAPYDKYVLPEPLGAWVRGVFLHILAKTDLEKSLVSSVFRGKAIAETVSDCVLLGTSDAQLRDKREQVLAAIQATYGSRACFPLLFLQGPPASGKSYLAANMGQYLAGADVFGPMTIGPDTAIEQIVGSLVLSEDALQLQEGILLSWAKSEAAYPVLVLDEANLAKPGFWNILRGIWDESPHVTLMGRRYALRSGHHVIMTGNDSMASGREFDPVLAKGAHLIAFERMSSDMIAELVLTELRCMPLAESSHDEILKALLVTEAGLKVCLPDHEFTVRDTLDVVHRFHEKLERFGCLDIGSPLGLIVQSVWEAFENELSPAVRPLLKSWISERLDCFDSWAAVSDADHAGWELFQSERRISEDAATFEWTNSVSTQIGKAVWNQLRILQAEARAEIPVSGKRGLLIEGPPGTGKDAILDQFSRMPAFQALFENSIHETCKTGQDYTCFRGKIQEAKRRGVILTISEINLLPSAYVEGLLNDALTGQSSPGFFLFLTQNAGLLGREKFAPSLMSRLTCVCVDDYTLDDLRLLLPVWANAYQIDAITVDEIVFGYSQLRSRLQAWECPVLPGTRELQRLVKALKSKTISEAEHEVYALFEEFPKDQHKVAASLKKRDDVAGISSSLRTLFSADPWGQYVHHWEDNCVAREARNSAITGPEIGNNSGGAAPVRRVLDHRDITPTTRVLRLDTDTADSQKDMLTRPLFTGLPPVSSMKERYDVGSDFVVMNGELILSPAPILDDDVYPAAVRRLPFLFPPGADEEGIYFGLLPIVLVSNTWTPIPSISFDQQPQGYCTADGVDLDFAVDRTGRWFVRSSNAVETTLMLRLDLTKSSSFEYAMTSNAIPRNATISNQILGVPSFPAAVARSLAALDVFSVLGLYSAMNDVEKLETLRHYFSNFSNQTLATRAELRRVYASISDAQWAAVSPESDLLVRIILSQSGACRHRAFAFVAVAQWLGFSAQMVTNQAHAFAEVEMASPNQGTLLVAVDFGGVGAAIEDAGLMTAAPMADSDESPTAVFDTRISGMDWSRLPIPEDPVAQKTLVSHAIKLQDASFFVTLLKRVPVSVMVDYFINDLDLYHVSNYLELFQLRLLALFPDSWGDMMRVVNGIEALSPNARSVTKLGNAIGVVLGFPDYTERKYIGFPYANLLAGLRSFFAENTALLRGEFGVALRYVLAKTDDNVDLMADLAAQSPKLRDHVYSSATGLRRFASHANPIDYRGLDIYLGGQKGRVTDCSGNSTLDMSVVWDGADVATPHKLVYRSRKWAFDGVALPDPNSDFLLTRPVAADSPEYSYMQVMAVVNDCDRELETDSGLTATRVDAWLARVKSIGGGMETYFLTMMYDNRFCDFFEFAVTHDHRDLMDVLRSTKRVNLMARQCIQILNDLCDGVPEALVTQRFSDVLTPSLLLFHNERFWPVIQALYSRVSSEALTERLLSDVWTRTYGTTPNPQNLAKAIIDYSQWSQDIFWEDVPYPDAENSVVTPWEGLFSRSDISDISIPSEHLVLASAFIMAAKFHYTASQFFALCGADHSSDDVDALSLAGELYGMTGRLNLKGQRDIFRRVEREVSAIYRRCMDRPMAMDGDAVDDAAPKIRPFSCQVSGRSVAHYSWSGSGDPVVSRLIQGKPFIRGINPNYKVPAKQLIVLGWDDLIETAAYQRLSRAVQHGFWVSLFSSAPVVLFAFPHRLVAPSSGAAVQAILREGSPPWEPRLLGCFQNTVDTLPDTMSVGFDRLEFFLKEYELSVSLETSVVGSHV